MGSFLVLGGTSFVGRHIVASALAAGHDVTMFNRGQTNPDLFPEVRRLTGDRTAGDVGALRGGEWDATVDVSAYVPRHVTQAADTLAGRTGHYTFISTVSVYAPTPDPIDESSPLRDTAPADGTEEITGETYGALKVRCEEAARAAFADCTIVRPGIVAGPHDHTERFTYWVRRLAAPGPVLACRPDGPVQVVHARDLADFTVAMSAARVADVFNATGPVPEGVAFSDLVLACARAAGVSSPEVGWVDEGFVAEHDVPLPLHLPTAERADGLFRASCAKAERAGLRNRSLVDTATDTLAWDRIRGDAPLRGMLDRDREAALLATWAARTGGR